MIGLLAQTGQDSVGNKNQSSSDTTKKNGFLGSGMSLLEIGLFLGSIGAFLSGIAAVVILIRRKQPQIQLVLPTSEDISKFLKNGQSDESSRVEKVVQNVERNPKASLVDKAMADAYRLQQDGKIDEAIQMWRDIADCSKGRDDNLAARSWFSIGYLYIDEGLNEEKYSADDLTIQLQLSSPEFYINSDAVEKALSSYSEAIRLKPDCSEAYCSRGKSKYHLGDYESAIEDYDEAIRLKPDFPEAYNRRGEVKSVLGEYESAFDDHTEAIRLKPDFSGAYNGRGNTKVNLDHPELALADYNEAISLKPDFPEAYGNRGTVKVALGDIEGAKTDLQVALELAERQDKDGVKIFVEERLQKLKGTE